MTKKFPLYMLLVALSGLMLGSCNEKEEEDPEIQEIIYSDVAVQAFSLEKNDSVIAHLDSVFFAIDLNNAVIYNPDSLPLGTNVEKLVLKITLPTVNSATLIEAAAPGGKAREIDYVATPKDSINFTYGNAKLKIESYDKKVTREYVIKVNVHKMVPDSLYWNRLATRQLPAAVGTVTAEKAVKLGDRVYCLICGGDGEKMAVSENPGDDFWEVTDAHLPASARVETLTAAGGSLYLLDDDGALFSSADGTAWTACGQVFHWLYGDYNGQLLASRNDGGDWVTVTYPAMTVTDVDDTAFPVEATSTMLTFETKWATNPTSIFIGGRTASGSLSADTWGYDGTTWAVVSSLSLPEGVESPVLVPYFSYTSDNVKWTATRYSVLLAWGGLQADGSVSKTLYISYDNGIRWRKADDLLQLPSYIPAIYDAQAIVMPSILTASRAMTDGSWEPIPSRRIPAWLMVETPGMMSRAVSPITEWECPYIYLFGGRDASGVLQNTIWRGVINRLTFKPLQ